MASGNNKKSMGRQKIKIVKIRNENKLQVTFSKRRNGLFKKASELCALTGTELALVIFSPGKKAYSFGSPGVNDIIQRFSSSSSFEHSPGLLFEVQRNLNLHNLNNEIGTLEDQMDQVKEWGASLANRLKENSPKPWWESPLDELEFEQLQLLKLAMEQLLRDVHMQSIKSHFTEIIRTVTYGSVASQSAPSASSASTAIVPFDLNVPGFGGGRPNLS